MDGCQRLASPAGLRVPEDARACLPEGYASESMSAWLAFKAIASLRAFRTLSVSHTSLSPFLQSFFFYPSLISIFSLSRILKYFVKYPLGIRFARSPFVYSQHVQAYFHFLFYLSFSLLPPHSPPLALHSFSQPLFVLLYLNLPAASLPDTNSLPEPLRIRSIGLILEQRSHLQHLGTCLI